MWALLEIQHFFIICIAASDNNIALQEWQAPVRVRPHLERFKTLQEWNCWGDPKKITKEVSGRAGKTASDSQATAYGKRLVCYQQRPWFILSVQHHLLLNSCCQSFSLFEKIWRMERSTLPWETVYSFLDMITLTAYTFSFSNFTPSHLIFYLQQP